MCSKNYPCEVTPRGCRACTAPEPAAPSPTAQDSPSWPEQTPCRNNFHVTLQATSCREKLIWIITSFQTSSYMNKKAHEYSTEIHWNAYSPCNGWQRAYYFSAANTILPLFLQRPNHSFSLIHLCVRMAHILPGLFIHIFPMTAAPAELFGTDFLLGMGGWGAGGR